MQSRRNLPLALLLLAVLLVYSNSFENSFHFDDFHTITDNPAVRSLSHVPRFFRDAQSFSVLPANQTYRPLVSSSLALDYAIGHGYVPFWFHLSTMVWFLLLICLLAVCARTVFDCTEDKEANRWLALGVAAWFGLHPAMAETVNYIIQRGDLYCLLGCVAALVLYARYAALRRSLLYLVPFAAAMLCKPPAVVFPLLLLLFVFFFETYKEQSLSQRWMLAFRAAVPSIVLAALLLWLQAVMTPHSYAPTILSARAYRLTQPYVWLRYAAALFLPLHLNVDTDLESFSALNGRAIAGLLFSLSLLLAALVSARQRRTYPIAYGLLWFLITQLPTSMYALSEVENDHRMFFSFPGIMLAVVWAASLLYEAVTRRLRSAGTKQTLRKAVTAICVLLLCGYAAGTLRRNAVWRSEATLWADDVAKSPHNGRGLMNYGLIRMDAGDDHGALALFHRALVYTPDYATLEINLGVVNSRLADGGDSGRQAEAERHFLRALALAPGDDLPHAFYGRWLLQHGRLQPAVEQLQTAVKLNPQRPMQRDLLMTAYQRAGEDAAARQLARETLDKEPGEMQALRVLRETEGSSGKSLSAPALITASLAAYQAGRYSESLRAAQEATTLDPRSAEAWNNVGAAWGGMQRWAEAIEAEKKAVTLNPSLTIAANNLRWFQQEQTLQEQAPKTAADWVNRSLELNRAGRFQDSIAAARRALQLEPRTAPAWNNIAAGEEALHHWDAAIAAARQALAIDPGFELARNNLAWSESQKQSLSNR